MHQLQSCQMENQIREMLQEIVSHPNLLVQLSHQYFVQMGIVLKDLSNVPIQPNWHAHRISLTSVPLESVLVTQLNVFQSTLSTLTMLL